jgi:hypothetical protein
MLMSRSTNTPDTVRPKAESRSLATVPPPFRVVFSVCGGPVTLLLAGMDSADCRECGAS